MRRRISRKLAVGVAVLLGALAVSASVIALGSSEDPAPLRQPAVSAVTESPAGDLDVFDRPATAADAIPTRVAERLAATGPFGVNEALSRRALTRGNRTVYLVAANDAVCYVLVHATLGAGTGCASRERIQTGSGGPAVLRIGDAISLYGVLPNGVEEVNVELASGEVVTTQAENNFFLVDIDASSAPRALSYAAGGRTIRNEVAIPALPNEG